MAEEQYITEEVWRPVHGEPFSRYYEVSTLGRIRSLTRVILHHSKYGKTNPLTYEGKIMKPSLTKMGYLTCGLRGDNQFRTYPVHRLVAVAFIPNPDALPVVNHENGVKTNNVVWNLSWMSHSENSVHAAESGMLVMGEDHYRCRLKDVDVLDIRRRYDSGEAVYLIHRDYPHVTIQQVWNISRRVSRRWLKEEGST